LKNYLLFCLISIFLMAATTSVSAEQTKSQQQDHTESHQFKLVDKGNLTDLEKAFVDRAKESKGVYQFGSLYVIALGPKPNPGYGLKLEKQEQILEQLNLYVKQTLPEQRIVYPQVISFPYIVGKLQLPPYTTLSVLDIVSKKPLFKDKNVLLDFAEKRSITDSRKVWSITFNRPITKSALEKYNIFVEKLGENRIEHPVKLIMDQENKNILKVEPLEPYEKGSTYLLHAENTKLNGKKMIIPFEVKDGLDTLQLEYDFTDSLNGWTGHFSDLSIKYNKEDFALDSGHRAIPVKGEALKKGLLLSGINRSDDLFMYAKKKMGQEEGLLPNRSYLMSMELDFYTNVDPGLIGVGGSPGEGVYMKAGASTVEPKTISVNNDLRMNIDKGEQASSGANAIVIGNIAKEHVSQEQYQLKKLKMTAPIKVTTNDNGELWAIFGTDSGFEGSSTLYYSNIKINLVKSEAD
jgi:hypothetical protein